MNRLYFILGIIFGFCLAGQPSWAAKANYVTDSFKITVRTGPSIENKIIAMLSSGQPVEILENRGDWSHVRLLRGGENQKEGWTLTRYLIDRLPWELQAKTLRDENMNLKQRLTDMGRNLNGAVRRERELTIELRGKARALTKSQGAYESLKLGAKGYLDLTAKHKAALSTLQTSQQEVRRLASENEMLRSSQNNKWFATGALVLLCGLMIGLTIGRQQKKRRSLSY
jgi:SH3 domain protein